MRDEIRRYGLPAAAIVAAAIAALLAFVLIVDPWSARSSQPITQGDVDCDGDVDAVDALFDLRWVADIEPFGDCTEEAGDTDCNGEIESTDALHILRHVGGFDPQTPPGCTPVGAVLNGDETPLPTGTPTATPTPGGSPGLTPTPTPTPTPTQAPTPTPEPTPVSYGLEPAFTQISDDRPIDIAVIPGTGNQEAVLITQGGMLRRVSLSNAFSPQEFGNLTELVNCCGEQGLLSIAFSPEYEQDSHVYLYYTRSTYCSDEEADSCSVIGRWTVSNNQISGDPDVILQVDQPNNNHNGGKLLFGPDDMLYLGLGDGGGANDQYKNGQNLSTLLGSIIRIDPLNGAPYAIPDSNPFVGASGEDEIYAYGFRNPWRMSFDRDTGELWVGDVGQGGWEEVDLVDIGENHGWPCYEGNAEFRNDDPDGDEWGCPPQGNLRFPETVYPRSQPDCAIVGGHVYRGDALPQLEGRYVYTDNCSGIVRAYDTINGGDPIILTDTPYFMLSMGELPDGELIFLTLGDGIYKLVQE